MAKRIAIIDGHPDRAPHLDHALAESYAEGARAAGHHVTLIRLATLDFPMLRSQQDYEHGETPEALRPAAETLLASDHIALFFPLWLGTMPALVKAFLEQVFRPGTAFEYREKALPKKLLAGKSARIVVTMGMPALAFRLFYGAHGIKGLRRSILGFVGIKPIRTSYLGGAGSAAAAKGWLAEMNALGRRGE